MITLIQASGFLITTAARFDQSLAVTTLELTVLANIFCTLATYICWWNKPTDVVTIHYFPLKTDIETILRNNGDDANGGYRDTPLDFVSRQEWAASLLWSYYVNILHRLGILALFKLEKRRPRQRLDTFIFPRPSTWLWTLFLLSVSLAYMSFFIGAWSFHFPSDVERHLWRAVVVTQCAITSIGAGFEIAMFETPIKHAKPLHSPVTPLSRVVSNPRDATGVPRLRAIWAMPCNNELTGNFPCLDVPFRSLLITTPTCALYVICRWIILTEDAICLRSLPASAFETVDWTRYLPWV